MKEKEIMKIFNKALKYFIKLLGKEQTSTTQLENVGSKVFLKDWAGVYPSDEIPYMKNKQVCIINVDPSGMSGSHWLGCGKSKNKIYIYDSYGRKIISLIPSYKEKDFLETDHDREQDYDTNTCGAYSLAFCYCLNQYGGEISKLI